MRTGKMAELYKINIIEAEDAQEITTVLKEKLAVP